jgi:SAM-dependent methyltransferase
MNPEPIVAPYVKPGMTVLEPGPGMGFFTLPLAQLVGNKGRVVAVDIQAKMISRLVSRAEKAGLAKNVDARVSSPNSLPIDDLRDQVGFTLAFAMVHELPAGHPFFNQVAAASRHDSLLLLAEPNGHVKKEEFLAEVERATSAGFTIVDRPAIKGSQTVLLRKN